MTLNKEKNSLFHAGTNPRVINEHVKHVKPHLENLTISFNIWKAYFVNICKYSTETLISHVDSVHILYIYH